VDLLIQLVLFIKCNKVSNCFCICEIAASLRDKTFILMTYEKSKKTAHLMLKLVSGFFAQIQCNLELVT
jgi:hypothetical protein